jgi:hypothetical protein
MDLGDSDDESEADDGPSAMSVDEREQRLQTLIPALDPKDWGRRTEVAAVEQSQPSFAEPGAKQKQKPSAAEVTPKIRPPILAPQEYDGHVIDSDDDEESEDEEGGAPASGWSAQSTAKMAMAGNQSRTELEASIKALADEFTKDTQSKRDTTSSKSKKSAVSFEADDIAEPEPDMAEEEQEFLKFAREALGINEEMWTGMLDERKARGGEFAIVNVARASDLTRSPHSLRSC